MVNKMQYRHQYNKAIDTLGQPQMNVVMKMYLKKIAMILPYVDDDHQRVIEYIQARNEIYNLNAFTRPLWMAAIFISQQPEIKMRVQHNMNLYKMNYDKIF